MKQEKDTPTQLRVALLGGFSASIAGSCIEPGYAKLRGLLAFLLLSARRPQRRDYLAQLFWPDLDETAGRQNLRRALFNLKSALGPAAAMLTTTRDSITFSSGDSWLDVDLFTAPPANCTSPPIPAQCHLCLSQMEQASALYVGEFMAGFTLPDCLEFEEWLQIQRESLQRRALALLEKIAQCHERMGNYARALPFALRITELEPWHDGAQQRLMRLYALNGQGSTALMQFEDYCRVLKKELGALPDEATLLLAERIRQGRVKPNGTADGEVPELPPHVLTTERRQVTVLYVELTPLGGEEPDEAMELLRAPQERCLTIIRHFSGHTTQIHGGGLLAYFGYPTAHEHAARHAVHAALAIVQGSTAQVTIRAAVHTGLVICGGDTSMPDTVGKTSKHAIQLRHSAAPGEAVLSRQTHDLVGGYFECLPLPDTLQPAEGYRAVRESGARTRLDAASRLTPMTGRQAESTRLLQLWRSTTHGARQIVLVQGEAGIGKSRLLHTLKQQLRAEPHEVRQLLCFPEFRQSPFHPLITMLEELFSFNQSDTAETKSAKLAHYLETHHPVAAPQAIPLLAQLMSLPVSALYSAPSLTPQKQKELTMQLLLDLLRMLTVQQPVLLIVEDLHWVDPSTLELLSLFMAQGGWRGLLVVLTARPEFIPPWHAALDAILVPSPLSAQEAAALAAAVNSALTAQTRQRILERADGIPLFIEEMARSARPDEQALIPATLHDLLAARMDGMGEAKYTAQLAATIGREFDVELLRRVFPCSTEALKHNLEALQQAGLIIRLNGHALQFKHALIQEAAYQTQTKADRQTTHRRIAEALQAGFPELVAHQPEIVAQHWSAAGELHQAIAYWITAGQRAARNSANMEAIEHFHAGLQLLAQLPAGQKSVQTEFTILINLCPVLYAAQGYGSREATQANRRLSVLSELTGDGPEMFLAKWALTMNTIANAGSRDVPPMAQRLLGMAMEEPLRTQAAHYAVANAAFWLGEFQRSHDHSEQGLALYRPVQHRLQLEQFGEDLSVSNMAYHCWSLYFLGFPHGAQRVCARMLQQARQMAHPHTLGLALCFASVLHRWLNKPAETLQLGAETIAVSRQHGFSVWLAAGEMAHGWALVANGHGEEGLAELRSSIAGMRAAIGGISVVFLSALIESLVQVGRYDEALEQIALAYHDAAATGDGHFTAELHRLEGECLLARTADEGSQAAACYAIAIELSRAQGAKSLELRAAISLSRLWQQHGRCGEALHLLKPLYEHFTEGHDTPLLQEAAAQLYSLQHDSGLSRLHTSAGAA